jgi:hypothetical protein
MHAGIQIAVFVLFFSLLMVCAYTCFVTPAEARSLQRRLRRLVRATTTETRETAA